MQLGIISDPTEPTDNNDDEGHVFWTAELSGSMLRLSPFTYDGEPYESMYDFSDVEVAQLEAIVLAYRSIVNRAAECNSDCEYLAGQA